MKDWCMKNWYKIDEDIDIRDSSSYDDVKIIDIVYNEKIYYNTIIIINNGLKLSIDICDMINDGDYVMLAVCVYDNGLVLLVNPPNFYDYYDKYDGIKMKIDDKSKVNISKKDTELIIKIE